MPSPDKVIDVLKGFQEW